MNNVLDYSQLSHIFTSQLWTQICNKPLSHPLSPVKQIRSFLWFICHCMYVLHCTCSLLIEIHFFLLGKYHLWQRKPCGMFLNVLQAEPSVWDYYCLCLWPVWACWGFLLDTGRALPCLAMPLLCLARLYDGWPLRQLIGNGLIYDLLLPQSNGFISFIQPMMSQPRSFQQCPSLLLWFLQVDDQWRVGWTNGWRHTSFVFVSIIFGLYVQEFNILYVTVCFGYVQASFT